MSNTFFLNSNITQLDYKQSQIPQLTESKLLLKQENTQQCTVHRGLYLQIRIFMSNKVLVKLAFLYALAECFKNTRRLNRENRFL